MVNAEASASTTACVAERSSPRIPAKQNGPTAMTSEAILTVEAYFDTLGTRDLELIPGSSRSLHSPVSPGVPAPHLLPAPTESRRLEQHR